MKRLAVSLTVVGVSAAVLCPAPAGAASSCHAVAAYKGGAPNITARDIHATRLGCHSARSLLRTYFRRVLNSAQTSGGCAEQRQKSGCRVHGYRCTATYGTAKILGRCAKGSPVHKRVIHFREYDSGQG